MAYLTAAEVKALVGPKATSWDDDTRISNLIARFEAAVEQHLGRAFNEREATETHPTRTGTIVLDWPYLREVTAVAVNGDDLSEDQIEDLTITNPTAGIVSVGRCGDVTVTYSHGEDAPPQAIKDALVDYVRVKYLAQTTAKNRQIESYEDDSGYSYTLGRPDPANGRLTGIPPVDDAIAEVASWRTPGIA